MNKHKALPEDIDKFFQGKSIFFGERSPTESASLPPTTPPPAPTALPKSPFPPPPLAVTQPDAPPLLPVQAAKDNTATRGTDVQPQKTQATLSQPHATTPPRYQDTIQDRSEKPPLLDSKPPRQPTTEPPRHHATVTPAMIETVRKAVKQLGKEAATHRFTLAEKQSIADLVYTHARQGYKTSENEIARIAINWLILDYKENGEKSILAQVLSALND